MKSHVESYLCPLNDTMLKVKVSMSYEIPLVECCVGS